MSALSLVLVITPYMYVYSLDNTKPISKDEVAQLGQIVQVQVGVLVGGRGRADLRRTDHDQWDIGLTPKRL